MHPRCLIQRCNGVLKMLFRCCITHSNIPGTDPDIGYELIDYGIYAVGNKNEVIGAMV